MLTSSKRRLSSQYIKEDVKNSSNLPIIILVIKIDFETESNSTFVIPIDSPVLVEAETDSKNASIKLALVRYFIDMPDTNDNAKNKAITNNASLNVLSDNKERLLRFRFEFESCDWLKICIFADVIEGIAVVFL